MVNPTQEEWLIVILAPELTLAAVPKSSEGNFLFRGVRYRSPDNNFLTAFYDRLVDDTDKLVGIRMNSASPVTSEWLETVPMRPYLHPGDGFLDIFLIGGNIPDAVSTGDQAFGGQVFSSATGDLALSLDVNYLCANEADYAAIQHANARWVGVEMECRHT